MDQKPTRVNRNHRSLIELIIILLLSVAVFWISSTFDIMENIVNFSNQHERWELDEIIIVSIFFIFVLLFYTVRYLKKLASSEKSLTSINRELQRSLVEVRQLKGIIPICAACKKIRDDSGYWQEVERYIREHSDVEFSHGVCPSCARKLYPELYKEEPAHPENKGLDG